MDKPKLFICIVLDESGSMSSCREATIGGFNEYLEDQKKNTDGIVLVTFTKFSNDREVVFVAKPVEEVEPLSGSDYVPHGGTALYDAIGFSITALEEDLKREQVTPGVVFAVITDGYNNASKEYTAGHIKKMIQEREEAGNWTFVFLGADIDDAAGKDIGFANTASYAKSASLDAFKAMSASTSNYANTKLYAGGGLKSDDFMAEAQDAWANVDAPRGIRMPSESEKEEDEKNGSV
jgi:hypothetical protein